MELRVGGKYRLSRKLGCGAFGDIYHGKHQFRKKSFIEINWPIRSNLAAWLQFRVVNKLNIFFIGTNIRTNEEVAIKLVSLERWVCCCTSM